MKTIEEKAKAYDKAFERVKELLSRCTDNRDRRTKVYRVEDIESIFPELKENDDERVKRILYSITSKMGFHIHDIFTEEEFQCFDAWSYAWLEKQDKKTSWKPSEEQMDALETAVSSLQSNTLERLYQDLKRETNYE